MNPENKDPLLPVNYCRECTTVHPPMQSCFQSVAMLMLSLLDRIGSKDQCRGCNKPIWWVRHRNGKLAPYTEVGLNHFIDCPQREVFNRKQETRP